MTNMKVIVLQAEKVDGAVIVEAYTKRILYLLVLPYDLVQCK
jgi:hypothetical protein